MSMALRLYLSNDTSARAAGAGLLADSWSERPEVQLIRTSSRGAFFLEPMVERDSPDGRLAWFNVTPDDLRSIVAGIGGTSVRSIPFLTQQVRFTFANFGETEPLALDEYQARGGLQGLEMALRATPDAIVEELRVSQLRGRGGAAFPVWNKWKVAQQAKADEKYVVANADEGDAGTYCDRMILEGDPFRLLEGMLICARAIGANRGYVYCRQEYPAAAATLRAAIHKADEAELLELDGEFFPIEVVEGAGSYVCGEETALLESIEGRRGVVRAKPPYPAESGLYGRPTIVSNVLTFAYDPRHSLPRRSLARIAGDRTVTRHETRPDRWLGSYDSASAFDGFQQGGLFSTDIRNRLPPRPRWGRTPRPIPATPLHPPCGWRPATSQPLPGTPAGNRHTRDWRRWLGRRSTCLPAI